MFWIYLVNFRYNLCFQVITVEKDDTLFCANNEFFCVILKIVCMYYEIVYFRLQSVYFKRSLAITRTFIHFLLENKQLKIFFLLFKLVCVQTFFYNLLGWMNVGMVFKYLYITGQWKQMLSKSELKQWLSRSRLLMLSARGIATKKNNLKVDWRHTLFRPWCTSVRHRCAIVTVTSKVNSTMYSPWPFKWDSSSFIVFFLLSFMYFQVALLFSLKSSPPTWVPLLSFLRASLHKKSLYSELLGLYFF